MDQKREAKQDLQTGWSSFVDSGSGRTLYGNEGTGDVAFHLMDVYKKVAALEVSGQVLEEPEGATPPKPAAKKRKTKAAKSVASSDTDHYIVTPSATKKKAPPPAIVDMMQVTAADTADDSSELSESEAPSVDTQHLPRTEDFAFEILHDADNALFHPTHEEFHPTHEEEDSDDATMTSVDLLK